MGSGRGGQRGLVEPHPRGSPRVPRKWVLQALSLHMGRSKGHRPTGPTSLEDSCLLPRPGWSMDGRTRAGPVSSQTPKPQTSSFCFVLSLETGHRGKSTPLSSETTGPSLLPPGQQEQPRGTGWGEACAQGWPWGRLLGSVGRQAAVVQGSYNRWGQSG